MTEYSISGPYDGAIECTPPEPGKLWLSIEADGEEIACVVHRGAEMPTEKFDIAARILVALRAEGR